MPTLSFRPEIKSGTGFSRGRENQYDFVGQKIGVSLETNFLPKAQLKVPRQALKTRQKNQKSALTG